MKRLLIELAVFLLLIAGIITSTIFMVKSTRELRRVKANYASEVTNDRSAQQTLSKSELKAFFDEELQQLKEYGIKPRQVENIVEIHYRYIDSVRYRDTLVWIYDTLNYVQGAEFDVATACSRVKGCIIADTLEIDEISYNDAVLVSLYKEKRKCLFQPRKVRAIAISACNGDTLSVIRNLKVSK